MIEKCLECGDVADWIRNTQFAGDHPYCDKHARLEKDFGEDDSYAFWTKVVHAPLKVIIAGGRDITDYSLVEDAIKESKFDISEIVSGGARGVDHLGELYAAENNIKLTVFPADWDTHGRAAGPIRNRQMAGYGEALIAIWDGVSRGTKNMIEEATKKGLLVYVKRTDNA
jgi:hypothetical protein